MKTMPETAPTGGGKTDWGLIGAFVALVLGAAAMGASPIFVRYASSDVGPFASAFFRVFLALPVLYVWMRIENAKKPDIAAKSRPFSLFPILAGLAFAGDLFFWHLSIMGTSIANATFFATLAPVWVIGITWLVLKQHVARSALVGIALCLCGGAILVGKTMSISPENLVGDCFGVITSFFFGLYFLAASRARRDGGLSAGITFVQSAVTAAVLLVCALIHTAVGGVGFLPDSARGLLALVGLALVSQVGGQGLLVVSMGRLPAVFSSLVIFLEAVVAAFLGWLLMDEAITGSQFLGGLLILVGIWVARPRSQANPPPTASGATE